MKRPSLTKEKVIAEAIKIANETGSIEKVTLREIANNLEVTVSALYTHVKGIPGLHKALEIEGQKQLLHQVKSSTIGKNGREALISLAHAYRSFVLQNPGFYLITQNPPDETNPDALKDTQELIAYVANIFKEWGLENEDAIHAIRALRALLHGFAHLETLNGFQMPIDVDKSFNRLIETFLDGLEK